MREAIFISVVGAYVIRTSSLHDKHSRQLFRIAVSFSSLVLLCSSLFFCLHGQPKLFTRDQSHCSKIVNVWFLFRHAKTALARTRNQ